MEVKFRPMADVRSRTAFSSYLNDQLSNGRVVFTGADAQKSLGITKSAFLGAAERQQRKHHLVSPRQGFYVIVPPQYLRWGGPPPAWYIDDLMKHEGSSYYVGLLKAAELHGATHQATMEFQVVTNTRLPQIRVGRSIVTFYYRNDLTSIATGIVDRKTDTGHMKLSSPELTALDLLRYPHAGGGFDNIATVIADLSEHMDSRRLVTLAAACERSVSQRLGYLLDRFGRKKLTDDLHRMLTKKSSVPWLELEPSLAKDSDLAPEPQERNERWHIIVRRLPERDE